MSSKSGIQLQQVQNQALELQEWLNANKNQAINIFGKSVLGSGKDWGINPEKFPWEECVEPPYEVEVLSFSVKNDKQCSFVVENTSYTLTITNFPSDKWGNTATFETLNSGIQLGYSDCQLSQYDGIEEIFRNTDIDIDELDDFDFYEFIEWVNRNYPDIISEVGEKGDFNGTAWEWCYYTTNIKLDDPQWIAIAQRYVVETWN